METAAPGPGHAMSLPETPSDTFITSATVVLVGRARSARPVEIRRMDAGSAHRAGHPEFPHLAAPEASACPERGKASGTIEGLSVALARSPGNTTGESRPMPTRAEHRPVRPPTNQRAGRGHRGSHWGILPPAEDRHHARLVVSHLPCRRSSFRATKPRAALQATGGKCASGAFADLSVAPVQELGQAPRDCRMPPCRSTSTECTAPAGPATAGSAERSSPS